ncbi:hypothetical protein GCM10027020_12630 [Nocardioides salsibiostraticola]
MDALTIKVRLFRRESSARARLVDRAKAPLAHRSAVYYADLGQLTIEASAATPISQVVNDLIETCGHLESRGRPKRVPLKNDVPRLHEDNVWLHRYWTFDRGQGITQMPDREPVVGLSVSGAVIWERTGRQRHMSTSMGDLKRSFDEGHLAVDPSKLVVVFDPSPVGTSASYSVMLPPDAWRDMLVLAALLFTVSETFDKSTSLLEKLRRATAALWSIREARKLPTEVPPRRLVRFVRSREEWTIGQIRRRLVVSEEEARALLLFCGYGEDVLDGLWHRDAGDDSVLMGQLIDALLELAEKEPGRHLGTPGRFRELVGDIEKASPGEFIVFDLPADDPLTEPSALVALRPEQYEVLLRILRNVEVQLPNSE